MRYVKDAIDFVTKEKIYFKGHAKATFMSDGKTVEDAINQIGAGGGGGINAETDPIFSASAAANITDDTITSWNNKQDKLVSGTSIKTINGVDILNSGDLELATKEELSNAFEVYIGEEEPTSDAAELWIDESDEGDSPESVIDTEMSDVSTNAVQNRVIKLYVDSVVGNINTILDNINGEEI